MSFQEITIGSANSMTEYRAVRAMSCLRWNYPTEFHSATSEWKYSEEHPRGHFETRIPETLDAITMAPWYYMVEIKTDRSTPYTLGYHWRKHGLFVSKDDALKAKLIY